MTSSTAGWLCTQMMRRQVGGPVKLMPVLLRHEASQQLLLDSADTLRA